MEDQSAFPISAKVKKKRAGKHAEQATVVMICHRQTHGKFDDLPKAVKLQQKSRLQRNGVIGASKGREGYQ
jgi:hypothetical protein